jgi:uncharacterized protein (TIGR03067 family)
MSRLIQNLSLIGLGLLVLVLLDSETRSADPQSDLASLSATWRMDSYIDEGKPDPQFAGAVQTFTADKYVVKVGDKTIRQGSFKIDASKTPKHIDLMPAAGPYKGKTLAGIYVLDGDRLHTCFPEPGQSRPTKFDSAAGSGNSEVKYTRHK